MGGFYTFFSDDFYFPGERNGGKEVYVQTAGWIYAANTEMALKEELFISLGILGLVIFLYSSGVSGDEDDRIQVQVFLLQDP